MQPLFCFLTFSDITVTIYATFSVRATCLEKLFIILQWVLGLLNKVENILDIADKLLTKLDKQSTPLYVKPSFILQPMWRKA